MSRSTWFVSLVIGAWLAPFARPAHAADARREIEEMEQKWAKAVQDNNPDEIGSFLHDTFTFVNPRGVLLHRTEHLDDFRSKRTVFTTVTLTEVEIRVYGGAAVVTTRPIITGYAVTPTGKTTFNHKPARFTDTLIRFDGKWLSVARHMSLALN
jgi:hypothetical protein